MENSMLAVIVICINVVAFIIAIRTYSDEIKGLDESLDDTRKTVLDLSLANARLERHLDGLIEDLRKLKERRKRSPRKKKVEEKKISDIPTIINEEKKDK